MGGELTSAKLNGANYFWSEGRSGGVEQSMDCMDCPHGDTRSFSSVYNPRDSIG